MLVLSKLGEELEQFYFDVTVLLGSCAEGMPCSSEMACPDEEQCNVNTDGYYPVRASPNCSIFQHHWQISDFQVAYTCLVLGVMILVYLKSVVFRIEGRAKSDWHVWGLFTHNSFINVI